MLNSSLPMELGPRKRKGCWAGEQVFGGAKVPTGPGTESEELQELEREVAALWPQAPQCQRTPTLGPLESHL